MTIFNLVLAFFSLDIMKQKRFITPFGPLILVSAEGRLVYCNWDLPECEPKLCRVKRMCATLEKSHVYANFECLQDSPSDFDMLNLTTTQLEEYFKGLRHDFDLPLKLLGTPFQETVWNQLAKIPYGETMSYGKIAEKCSKPGAFRAVARACGANPIAIIIPCHRVVAANSIGGYTGGINLKSSLLDLEIGPVFVS